MLHNKVLSLDITQDAELLQEALAEIARAVSAGEVSNAPHPALRMDRVRGKRRCERCGAKPCDELAPSHCIILAQPRKDGQAISLSMRLTIGVLDEHAACQPTLVAQPCGARQLEGRCLRLPRIGRG